MWGGWVARFQRSGAGLARYLWRDHRLITVAVALSLVPRVLAALAFRPAQFTPDSFFFAVRYGNFALTNSDGMFLWSRTMSFANCQVIRPPAELRRSRTMTFANCAVVKPPADEAGPCPRQPAGQRPAASTFIWEPDSPLNNLPGKKFSPGKNALALDFALRAIAAQPA
jgi:hypothetical protein